MCCGEGGSTQQHPWLFLIPTGCLHHLPCPSWKCHGVFHSLTDSWAPLKKCFATLYVLVFCLGSVLLQLDSRLLLCKNNLMLSPPFHCPGNARCPLGHPRPPKSISLLHTGILIYSFFSQFNCKYQQGGAGPYPCHCICPRSCCCCSLLWCPGSHHVLWDAKSRSQGSAAHLGLPPLPLGPAQCSDQRQMPPLFQEHQGSALHAQGGASHPAHSIWELPSPCAAASRAGLGSIQPEQAAN